MTPTLLPFTCSRYSQVAGVESLDLKPFKAIGDLHQRQMYASGAWPKWSIKKLDGAALGKIKSQ